MPRFHVNRSPSRLRWWLIAGGAMPVITACGGIGLGSVTVGSNVAEPDAAASPDAGAQIVPTKSPDPPAETGSASPDAGSPYSTGVATSPLCNVNLETGCDPDYAACLFDVGDGGGGGGDGGAGSCQRATLCEGTKVPSMNAACRVVASEPTCSTAIGTQLDGMACMRSSDCAAELECVGSGVGMAGICRHYCCGLACIGANTFCDIEPVFQEEQLVPVCASGPPCALLGSDCTRGENCTVVNASTGQTACVTPGTGVLDGDCTKEKCGANLACIDNTCKELCSGTTECPSGRMCVPLTALGGGIGICTK